MQVIEELIRLAKEMNEAPVRGGRTWASARTSRPSTMALETNDSAVRALGEETIKTHRPGTRGDGPAERQHRLDGQGERPGEVAHHGEADTPEVRLPARQAGEGHSNGLGAGRGAL